MTSLFDSLRRGRSLRLSTAFAVAAGVAVLPLPRESADVLAYRHLARLYAEQGPLIEKDKFLRLTRLMEKIGADAVAQRSLSGGGLCLHGGSGSTSSGSAGGTAALCPQASLRRRQKGDLSFLLAIDHFL